MSGYFVLKQSGTQYMFNLKAGNHETLLTSERYSTKQSAQGGIASVQQNAAHDERFKKSTAKDGSMYFTLTAGNGESLGRSEMYPTAAARDKGIAAVKTAAVNAPTKEGA